MRNGEPVRKHVAHALQHRARLPIHRMFTITKLLYYLLQSTPVPHVLHSLSQAALPVTSTVHSSAQSEYPEHNEPRVPKQTVCIDARLLNRRRETLAKPLALGRHARCYQEAASLARATLLAGPAAPKAQLL
jgi:hypothetical protein